MKQDSIFPTKPFFTFTILVVLVLTLTHCKKRAIAYETNINGNNVVICPVNKVTDTIQLYLSSLIESCEVVKLQNITEGLIDRAWHTEISKDYICIKTYGQYPAKLFDIHGQFIRNIGSIGRGPGEYSTLNGLQFSPSGDMLYLFPFGTTRKILAYDISGNHIKDIPLVYTQRKFKAFFSPDSIITVVSMPFQNDSAICFQQTLDGRLIQKVSPPAHLINQSFDGEVFTNYLTPEYDLYNTASDTLYHYNIEKNTLEPKFAKDFGENKFISVSREIPGYYFFYFYNKENPSRKIIVDKTTLDANYFTLKNDFFGNIEASPVFSNGYFINNIAAITLKNQIEKTLRTNNLSESDRKKLVEFNTDLKLDDNNIIFYGKLK
ncbi:MAG: 6-bladed beta-propeller [Bacteroidales bacterium]